MVFGLLRDVVVSGAVWAAGDFFAQFWSAHASAAARRARGETRIGDRPTASAMASLVDVPRLVACAGFGAALSPFARHWDRATRPMRGSAMGVLAGLTARQFLFTPLTLLAYFNAGTALRGGFAEPDFLRQYADERAAKSYTAADVERRILVEALPPPLVASWAVFAPLALMEFVPPGRFLAACGTALCIPWTAYVSYTQSNVLL